MKETKVYVDKLPKSCWDCFCQDNENGRCKILEKYTDYVPKDCPLIDIKTHDRELVRQVCEKIKEKAFGLWYFVLNEQKEYFEGNRYVLSEKDFNEILDQIQQEFENER